MFSHLQTFSDLRRGLKPSVKKTRLEEGKNSAPAQRWVQSSLTPGIGVFAVRWLGRKPRGGGIFKAGIAAARSQQSRGGAPALPRSLVSWVSPWYDNR